MHDAAGYARLLKIANTWEKPVFPLKGADILATGVPEGPELGKRLKTLETAWIESGFQLSRDALLERAAKIDK